MRYILKNILNFFPKIDLKIMKYAMIFLENVANNTLIY